MRLTDLGPLPLSVLFGSIRQVELAAACARALTRGDGVAYQPLIEELRTHLRIQLGLDAIPPDLALPQSGPGRAPRTGRGEGEGGARAGARGGGGGGMGGAAGARGVGAGMMAAGEIDERAP